jgi:hypothetical protein
MSKSNIEGMKKIIEDKKKKSIENSGFEKNQNMVGQSKVAKRKKRGGFADSKV